jgi:hypothetical protein
MQQWAGWHSVFYMFIGMVSEAKTIVVISQKKKNFLVIANNRVSVAVDDS